MKPLSRGRAMNERIVALRQGLLENTPAICPERAVLFTESMKKSEGQPIAKRRAQAFYEVLDKMTIFIRDGELLAGNQASSVKAAPVFPEYSVDWMVKEFNGDPYHFADRPCDKYTYSEDAKQKILKAIDYWKGKTLIDNVWSQLPEDARKAWSINAIDDTWCAAAGLGNVLPDYVTVLEHGLDYLIEKAQRRIDALDLTEPGTISQLWFLESVITANQAVKNFALRFSRHLAGLAEHTSDIKRKEELLTMSRNCLEVPSRPAKTFWQALQSVWFVHLVIQIETNGHAISLGRFDQYLWRYYRNDIANGTLTRDGALELIESFFIKVNEINKLRSWPDTEYFPSYHLAQNLTIGGQNADGTDAANELSHIILDATGNLRLTDPSVSLKWYEGTNDAFMNHALDVIQKHKGGQPALYNDRAVIKILENMGVRKGDLHEWAPVGCIEASIPGKWDFAAKGSWLNVGKIFEITLNNGKDPATGITLLQGDGDLGSFSSTRAIMDALKKQLYYFMQLQVITEHISDEMHILHDQNAFRSSLIHDCIERGKSLIEGGSIYSADGGPAVGHISVGDSLAAIEYAVFRKKIITAKQLQHAIETNFEDAATSPSGEDIRQLIINKAPKFGNDDDAADGWTVEINDFLGSTYQKRFKNSRYGKGPLPATFALSQSSVTGNVAFGKSVGALPSGRKAGSPLNNGVSPANGAELNGPTALIRSEGKLPSIWFQKGSIFNMRLSPETIVSTEGKERVLALIKTHFNNLQYHIQFNVLDDTTLLDAQKNPEEYRDLMVRIAGYSAFFTPLSKELQEDVMARMKFDMVKG
jgi:formate C-acetyltransferase